MKITTKQFITIKGTVQRLEYFRRRAMLNPQYKAEHWIFETETRSIWG